MAKTQEKRRRRDPFWCFFSKVHVEWIIWPSDHNQGRSFQNQDTFRFSKRTGEASPLPPSWALVNVAEYWSIPLNIPKYSWKCLNKLFWLCQRSEYEYVWSSDMFNMFLKMPRVLNKPRFWIWYDFIFRVTQCSEYFWLCLSPYASLMPKYASICLNVPEYAWTWVNIAECS